MTAPDLTTEVVGYRQWYVTPDLELRSCGVRAEKWVRGDQTAGCRRVKESGLFTFVPYVPDPCGDCPGPDCECGFYALHDPSDHWYGKPASSLWNLHIETDVLVSGIVVAWGALQVHHQGFRSQHARIAALALPKTKRDQVVAQAAASAYRVPCVPSRDLPKIAAEYGSTVPVEFRPAKPQKPKDELSLYKQLFRGYATSGNAGLISPNTWTMTTAGIPTTYPHSAKLWTPDDDKDKTPDDKLGKYAKPPANRQGPPRPKRAPKRL